MTHWSLPVATFLAIGIVIAGMVLRPFRSSGQGGAEGLVLAAEPPQILVPFFDDQKKLWGYMDEQGRTRIMAQFAAAGPFAEGRAQVMQPSPEPQFGAREETVLIIDEGGRTVFITKGQWHADTVYASGRIAIWEAGERWTYGVYDRDGRRVFSHDGTRPVFSEGLASFRGDAGDGYFDVNGKVAIAPAFWITREFSEGLAAVHVHSSTSPSAGYIDRTGAWAFKKRFTSPQRFSEGLAHVGEGFIDKSGKFVFRTPAGWRPRPFSDGLALIEDWSTGHRRFGFIARDGRWAIPPRFVAAGSFSEGLAAARDATTAGYIDKSGAFVITTAMGEPFKGGIARVQKSKGPLTGGRTLMRAGYIDKQGNWLRDWEEQPTPPALQ